MPACLCVLVCVGGQFFVMIRVSSSKETVHVNVNIMLLLVKTSEDDPLLWTLGTHVPFFGSFHSQGPEFVRKKGLMHFSSLLY